MSGDFGEQMPDMKKVKDLGERTPQRQGADGARFRGGE